MWRSDYRPVLCDYGQTFLERSVVVIWADWDLFFGGHGLGPNGGWCNSSKARVGARKVGNAAKADSSYSGRAQDRCS